MFVVTIIDNEGFMNPQNGFTSETWRGTSSKLFNSEDDAVAYAYCEYFNYLHGVFSEYEPNREKDRAGNRLYWDRESFRTAFVKETGRVEILNSYASERRVVMEISCVDAPNVGTEAKRLTFSRFEQEILGALGDFWKREAEKKVAEYKAKAELGEILVDENGAAYWKSNGRYLPYDCAEILNYTGFAFDYEATKRAEKKQLSAESKEYRKSMQNYVYSDEELCEMRAAFGPGTQVVNVLTGQTVAVL